MDLHLINPYREFLLKPDSGAHIIHTKNSVSLRGQPAFVLGVLLGNLRSKRKLFRWTEFGFN